MNPLAPEIHLNTTMDLATLANEHVNLIGDQFDHPELWELFQQAENSPDLNDYVEYLKQLLSVSQNPLASKLLNVLYAVTSAHTGNYKIACEILDDYSNKYSQCPLVAGAFFHVQKIAQPDNPKFDLTNKICKYPFERMEILENGVHQCCASWLHLSIGNLKTQSSDEVWNSPNAQAVRKSVLDGSYRYCSKILCPEIQGNRLFSAEELKNSSPEWKKIIEEKKTHLEETPKALNLVYDRTCNLFCPSCRRERFAIDAETRKIYEEMQERSVIPMLKKAKHVCITGSGDPFASKIFRQLLSAINKTDFPDLKVEIMTNGMLLTRKEWEKFSHLSGQICKLRVSIDAATKETHELLRRGAKWETMLENMKFFGELYQQKVVDTYHLIFIVQSENFREMGDAVSLAKEVGANLIEFYKISNWGTFSEEEFRNKTPFNESHPLHDEFKRCMQDERLKDPIVQITDLESFLQ